MALLIERHYSLSSFISLSVRVASSPLPFLQDLHHSHTASSYIIKITSLPSLDTSRATSSHHYPSSLSYYDYPVSRYSFAAIFIMIFYTVRLLFVCVRELRNRKHGFFTVILNYFSSFFSTLSLVLSKRLAVTFLNKKIYIPFNLLTISIHSLFLPVSCQFLQCYSPVPFSLLPYFFNIIFEYFECYSFTHFPDSSQFLSPLFPADQVLPASNEVEYT